MNPLKDWFVRQIANPQVVLLTFVLGALALAVVFLGGMMAPVIAAIVIAYLLEGLVTRLQRLKTPRIAAVTIVFAAFMTVLLFAFFGLLPLLFRQLTQLFQQAPAMLATAQQELLRLPGKYPEFLSEQQILSAVGAFRQQLFAISQWVLSTSLASVVTVVTVLVYIILVPFLVFFLLKDKDVIVGWIVGFLPEDRRLATNVWREVDAQLGNYVRGKFWEIVIVGMASYAAFETVGLEYAVLLAALSGLSVLIPYIGVTVVAIPVALVAYFQFGLTSGFWWALGAYGFIQIIDGNILATLLLSGAVNLHPVAIVVAVLFFGGLWGFWGLFFAVPLATVVQAVLNAWPGAMQDRARRARQTPEARLPTAPEQGEAESAGAPGRRQA